MSEDCVGLHVHVGISGAGKTYSVRKSVYRAAAEGMPVLVIDRMHEWSEVPQEIAPVTRGAQSIQSAIEHVEAGARLVVVRAPGDVAATAESACRWARDYPGPAGVAIPEAHRVAPSQKPLPTALEDVACAWRHYRVGLWTDTQRFSLMSRTITENARDMKLFAIVGDRDLKVCSEIGGPELVKAVRECAVRLANGEAGWHVPLSVARVPPYSLAREE